MLAVAAAVPWTIAGLDAAFALAFGAFNAGVILLGWRAWMQSLKVNVLWDASGNWWFIESHGQRRATELRPDSVICPQYLWLKWNCDGRRMQRFVLRADCSPEMWRRWQARLHWQARQPARDRAVL